jgi:hypothetical protein
VGRLTLLAARIPGADMTREGTKETESRHERLKSSGAEKPLRLARETKSSVARDTVIPTTGTT